MELCFSLCADSMGFLFFPQLNTFKIKDNLLKTINKMEIHPLQKFPIVVPLLCGCVVPSSELPYWGEPVDGKTPQRQLLSGLRKRIIQDLWVQPKVKKKKEKKGFASASEVSQSLGVQKETLQRDQNEAREENGATLESTTRLNIVMKGERNHIFRIHRQLVNNKS